MVVDCHPFHKTSHPAALTWFPHLGFLLQNKIQRIENLACITSLRYVAPRQGKSREWVVGGEKLATPLELAWGSLSLTASLSPQGFESPLCQPATYTGSLGTWRPALLLFPSSFSSRPVAQPCLCLSLPPLQLPVFGKKPNQACGKPP